MHSDDEFPRGLDDEWDRDPSFVGPCTCTHDIDQHGWGQCLVEDCDCEAGWEE